MINIMEDRMKRTICILVFIIMCSLLITSCFTYGSPDSIFVNFVGRDLENIVEYPKTGVVSLENMDFMIVYRRDTLVEMEPPERRNRGNYLFSYLILRNISMESEEIIIYQGNLNEQVIVDEHNRRLFYISLDFNYNRNSCYFNIFNYETMENESNILISDRSSHINRMLFDEENGNVYFDRFDGHLMLNIYTNNIVEITREMYQEVYNKINISNSFTYTSQDNVLKLFFIVPYSDYLPANYKHKYNGTYINNGPLNIRISNSTDGFYTTTPVFWLEEGKYFIRGRYLFETSGKLEELQIADGNILALF